MAAYYNENDPYAAQWLRNLMAENHICPGFVDERSIVDVQPGDLTFFTQCHFFAGIGVWSHALRCAGWPDDRPVWTGSCPCQPFSGAGKRGGFADDRHLWPVWFNLIRECNPCVILGEQVASPDGYAWFDDVQAHMEGLDHACGAVVTPAAGYGAPEERHRIYWMAYANDARPQGRRERGDCSGERVAGAGSLVGGMADTDFVACRQGREIGTRRDYRGDAQVRGGSGCNGLASGLADSDINGCDQARGSVATARHDGTVRNGAPCRLDHAESERHGTNDMEPIAGRRECAARPASGACAGGMDHTASARCERALENAESQARDETRLRLSGAGCGQDRSGPASPVNGFWRAADWLFCRDGKWRPVEPGTFTMVDGAANRVGKLRAYGNAIVAPQATEFIETVMEWTDPD